MEHFDPSAVAAAAWKQIAEQREDAYRSIARERLPRRLGWVIDRPGLLKLAYRLRPSWRPTVFIGTDGDTTVTMCESGDGVMTVLTGVLLSRADDAAGKRRRAR